MRRILLSPLACSLLSLPLCLCAQTPISPVPSPAAPGASATPQSASQIETQRAAPPDRRIPNQKNSTLASLQGLITDESGRPMPAVEIRLEGPQAAAAASRVVTSGDGIFRLLRVPAGTYDLIFTRRDGLRVRQAAVILNPGEVLSIEVKLPAAPDNAVAPLTQKPEETLEEGSYKELSRRPDSEGNLVAPPLDQPQTPESLLYTAQRDRFGIPFPSYRRYLEGETPYVLGHWYDPFNRNILKGDRHLFGKYFFIFTGDAITAAEGRRLPTPAGQSTADPGEIPFFGRGGQFFIAETLRTTFDFFHGDTLAFRPVDFRIHIQPAISLNYLAARENQVVSPDVRAGTTRFDTKTALQQAFVEVKLHDFGPNYDFLNLRVGIQPFVSDFRGFIFADENLGVRLFGNLHSNRIQYNLVGFELLEKDANAGLNTFKRRGREVAIANVFIQDAFFKGYTTQFSYHFVRDSNSVAYNKNGFVVRPSPIGSVQPSRKEAHYLGWTGDGHIGRTNITHAFYEVRGDDVRNELSNERAEIDAQFAAAEFSQDRDFLRFRVSGLFASGDNNPRDRVARGFSSIVDGVAFAGGEFSFFSREGIPFTRAGVALKSGDSFLPDMRGDKNLGQSNFVNPGIFLYNVGADAQLTQKLKFVVNANFLQFARTQVLDFLLQQNRVPRTIGLDLGTGVIYRPYLTDNIVIHAGMTGLVPSSGYRQIYNSQSLFSAFVLLKFQF